MATLRLAVDPSEMESGGRRGESALDRIIGKSKKAEDTVTRSSDRMGGSVTKFAATAGRALGAAAASYASFQAAAASVNLARDFNASLAETSTLLDGSAAEMDLLASSARDLAKEFGGNATEQVRAFYQAISAGAGDVTEAAELLDSANRLAIGGATDTTTAVDALTTATNAYAASGLTAAQASDALFVGVRAGKTTAAELAAGLGNVVPIASAVGVSFDEVVAATAALTTQGQSTGTAITGLRGILSGVIKPTSEAAKLADKLGLAFDAQALKSQGLAGFLEQVIEKTGGSQAAMAQLFGSVEALNAVLAFAGGAGESFSGVLSEMESKAGATDAAYQKMAESLDQRWTRATAAASDLALSFGNALLTVVVPALETSVGAMDFLIQNSDALVVSMAALAATQIPAMIGALATMTAGMSASAVAAGVATGALTLLRGAVVALGGPLGVVYGLLGGAAAYFLVFKDNAGEAEQAQYDAALGTAALRGELDAFYRTDAPSAGKAAIALANDNHKLAASAFEVARAELAKRRAMLKMRESAGANGSRGSIKDTGITETVNTVTAAEEDLISAEKAFEQAVRDRKVAASAVTGGDYSGVTLPRPAPTTPPSIPEIPSLDIDRPSSRSSGGSSGGGSRATVREIDRTKDAYDGLMASLDPVVAATQRLEDAQETVNAAMKAGHITSTEAAEAYDLARERFDEAVASADKGASVWDKFKDTGANAIDKLIEGTMSLKDAVSSLIKEMVIAIAKKALLGNGTGSSASDSLGGIIMGAFGFSDGAAFSGGRVTAFATGGVVNGPTMFPMRGGTGLMGEAGPEAIMPLTRGRNGKLGVQASGNAAPQRQSLEVVLIAPPGFTAQQRQEAQGISLRVTEAKMGANTRAQADRKYLSGGR